MKKILIRCDQNELSGFGHFSRCLSLARHILMENNADVVFLGNYSEFSISLLNKYKIEHKNIEDKNFKHFKKEHFKNITYVILDSYFINQSYINKITSLNLKTIFIDDTCTLDFENIDLVINFRIDAENMFLYNSKNKALGSDYFIYKPEFREIKEKSEFNQKIKNILIFLGGMNFKDNIYNQLIKIINKIDKSIKISIISNGICIENENVNILKPIYNIEKYLDNTDFIINGGGLIKYESVFCNIPSAVLSSTKLQYEDTCILESKKIIFNLGYLNKINNIELEKNLKFILENVEYRKEIYNNSKTVFSTNSVKKLLKKINTI